jgi:hypothetical protein
MTLIADGNRDDNLARIVRIMPAEVVAAYLAIGNLIPAINVGHLIHAATWFSFVFFWLATPIILYLSGRTEQKRPSTAHYVLSTIAFPIWAYNVSASVQLYGIPFNSGLAGILLILFMFVSGFVPIKGTS